MKLHHSIFCAAFALAASVATTQAADLQSADMSGIYVRGDLGGSYLGWNSPTNSWAVIGDVGLGYQFGENFRTDLTYNMSGNYGTDPVSTLSTQMVLASGYYDFRNDTPFTPYLGAGVGYGWQNGTGNTVNDQGIAFGLNAGVAYDLSKNLALDAGYRFHDIIGATQNTPEHQVLVGLRVKF